MNKNQCESLTRSDCELVQSLEVLSRNLPKVNELFDRNTIYESVLSLLAQPAGVVEATPDNKD